MDEELRRALLARRDEDQRIRNAVSSQPGGYMVRLPDELAAEWQRIDEENTRWLAEVLSARGWPGPSPIEDRERLDERRAEAGLEPFAAYEARMRNRA